MSDRLYPKQTNPADKACPYSYWMYISKGDDDAEKECCCDLDGEVCYGKDACGKESE